MKIKIGDVYSMPTGEAIKIEEFDPNGMFTAQIRSMTTGQWTDFHMQGESAKLPNFLEEQGAVKAS